MPKWQFFLEYLPPNETTAILLTASKPLLARKDTQIERENQQCNCHYPKHKRGQCSTAAAAAAEVSVGAVVEAAAEAAAEAPAEAPAEPASARILAQQSPAGNLKRERKRSSRPQDQKHRPVEQTPVMAAQNPNTIGLRSSSGNGPGAVV